MAVKVLGPMETGATPLSPRERTMLAALIVRRGTSVSPAELAEARWADDLPNTWNQQVRNAIAGIRHRLGPGSVQTAGWEYRLGIEPDSIDSVQFERLVSSARGHALQGEHDRAIDLYRRALSLWRGAPLQDVANWEPGIVEAQRLAAVRTSAEEELLEARLACGEHRAVIPDAERLVREDPLREERWAVLALANYRTDRQADALAVLRAARERLADELGIEPGARLTQLETAMLRRDPALLLEASAPQASSECPYPGLRAFGAADADLFFGRDTDIEAVLERVGVGGLLAVAGPSGSGKSSLVLAGVLPRLASRGVTTAILGPTTTPGELSTTAERASVVVLDQVEELLERSEMDVAAFGAAAAAALGAGTTIIMTIRSDALDRARAVPGVGEAIGQAIYLLGPLSPAGLHEAIERPAHAAALRLEPGLIELAVRDAGDRTSILPHLSHALRETWGRREGATLTVDGYEASGGIAGAIAQSAEEVYRALGSDDKALCRSLMLRLIERGPDGITTRRRVPSAPLVAEPARRRVVERLVRSRLVAVDGETVTVTHEAVARAWPRLDGWLEEDAEAARLMRALDGAATSWDADGRRDDDLLRGSRLDATLEWRDAASPDLTTAEREFLDSSSAAAQTQTQAIAERAEHERHQNRRLRGALAGAAVLLVAAVTAGGVAVVRNTDATRIQGDAQIAALTATSLALRSSDLDVAALLAAEAYRRWPEDPRVRAALMGSMTAAQGLVAKTTVPDAVAIATAVIPGTDTMLIVRERSSDDDAMTDAVVMDLLTAEIIRTMPMPWLGPHEGFARDVSVSADGRVALVQTSGTRTTGCCINHLDFFDVATGERLAGSQVLDSRTSTSADLGDDGEMASFVHPISGTLLTVDTHTGSVAAAQYNDPAETEDMEGAFDGAVGVGENTVAVSSDRAITIYDRRTREVVRSIPVAGGRATTDLAFDGRDALVGVGTEGMVRVSVDDGSVVWTEGPPRANGYADVAVAADRGTVYAADWDGQIDEFALDTGEPTGRSFITHLGGTGRLTVSAGEDELIFADRVAPIVLRWRLDGSGPASTLVARDHAVAGGFGDDGESIIVAPLAEEGEGTGMMVRWDLQGDRPVGDPTTWMGWMSNTGLAEWSEADGVGFTDVETGAWSPGNLGGIGADGGDRWITSGGPGRYAYLIADQRIEAFDPTTGMLVGQGVDVPVSAGDVTGVSDGAGEDRLLVNWWDGLALVHTTAVFDLASGERRAIGRVPDGSRGVATSDGSVINGDFHGLTRSRIDTLEPYGALPKPATLARTLEVSDDGRTLLVTTWDQRAWLYDLDAGVRLGDAIATGGTDIESAKLSAEGLSMVTTADEGVLLWTLDPADQAAAACLMAGRELTAQEWQTYLGELGEQSPTCGGTSSSSAQN